MGRLPGGALVDAIVLVVELAVLFFGVTFVIQLLQRRVGADRLSAWMGGRPVVSALKGIGLGFITPFCTFSAIPLLVGLRQAGVPPAGYVAFLSAAPVLDPVLFGALIIIVGPEAAALYAAIAFVGAMTLALTAQGFGIEGQLKSADLVPASCESTMHASGGCAEAETPVDAAWAGARVEVGAAATAASALLRSVRLLLLAGVGVGLLIEAFVRPEHVAALAVDRGSWAIPLAAALGTPLYVQTSLFVPIANSLGNAGVAIGAIVALTISGAGANIPEFLLLSRLASVRLILIFFGYVFSVAVLGGLLAQVLLS